jgi:hypothetical protein
MLSNPGHCLTGSCYQSVKVNQHGLTALAVDDFSDVCHLTTVGRKSQGIERKTQSILVTQLFMGNEPQGHIHLTAVPTSVRTH